ncbi:MAG: hypothetical protein JSU87_13780 [Gemmatimonadota bacterium]|nr:MAG: hypothetical protein JSU87_13780 [Gemmatimonadota bacterium]
MNSRERVAIAMNLGEPDRVPVFCQLSIGHYFVSSGGVPLDIWFRSQGFAQALVELQRRYGFDGILINLPGRDPDFEKYIDRLEEGVGATTVHWKNGGFTRVPHDDNPHYYTPGGKRYFPSFVDLDPEDLWYVEPWDITGITYPYTWSFESEPRPFADFFPSYHLDTIREVKRLVGAEVSLHSEIFSPFSQFLELLDYENALMALLDDPGKTHACLQRLTQGAIQLAERQAAAGVDAILISSAFAGGGLISREHYTEFVLPYERRVVTETKTRHPEVKVYTHTCGAIGDRLDLMLGTSTEGIDTLDPPPLGTVELEAAVPQLKGRAFIKGNIDAVNTLLYGDEEKVRQAVVHRLEVAKPGGGYILSTACSVPPAVRPELLEYMSGLVAELGAYG